MNRYDLEAASEAYYSEKFENDADVILESEVMENPTAAEIMYDPYEYMFFDPNGNLYEEF